MRLFAGLAAILVVVATLPLPLHAEPPCSYSPAQRAANAERDWSDFEFATDRPGGPMFFNARRCYREAVRTSRDYLARRPVLTERQRAISRFHMARNAAWAGDRKRAAVYAKMAYRADQAADVTLDWNTYVRGFHAYLVGNADELAASHAKLTARGGEGNLTNAAVLKRCMKCIAKAYSIVTGDARCAT